MKELIKELEEKHQNCLQSPLTSEQQYNFNRCLLNIIKTLYKEVSRLQCPHLTDKEHDKIMEDIDPLGQG